MNDDEADQKILRFKPRPQQMLTELLSLRDGKIAKQLVSSRIAASMQITKVDSFYRWQDKVTTTMKFTLTIKAPGPSP